MKVYVVTHNTWETCESDTTLLRAVFDSEYKAIEYVADHSNEVYEVINREGAYFYIQPVELNEVLE